MTGSAPELTERQMADIVQHYDLNSLEPITFEMLCQALTAEVLGPGTEIRGGYDPRHREDAAFKGRLRVRTDNDLDSFGR
jgi:hypothetical protein